MVAAREARALVLEVDETGQALILLETFNSAADARLIEVAAREGKQ